MMKPFLICIAAALVLVGGAHGQDFPTKPIRVAAQHITAYPDKPIRVIVPYAEGGTPDHVSRRPVRGDGVRPPGLIHVAAQHITAYPDKPIRVIVPYAPGGGNDVVMRILAPRLSERLGQSVVVDNRAGAASMLGTDIVARAPRDGYTLLICDPAHVINPAVYSKVPYHPVNDFTPVAIVASTPLMIVAHPAVPAKTLREFVALAKSQPGRIVLAYGGIPAQMLAELFKMRAAADFNLVPYKGTGPALTDVVAGQIQSTVTSTPAAIPMLKSGRLRGLGVASLKRTLAAPDVPTFAEAGMEIVAENWYGIQAPAGIPAAVRAKLEREFIAVAQSPEIRERFLAIALEPSTATGAEFKAVVAADLKKWSALVKAANIKVE